MKNIHLSLKNIDFLINILNWASTSPGFKPETLGFIKKPPGLRLRLQPQKCHMGWLQAEAGLKPAEARLGLVFYTTYKL